MAKITAAIVLTLFAATASAQTQYQPPTDNDLRTAYCIVIVKKYVAIMEAALGEIQPEKATTSELKQSLTKTQAETRDSLANSQANLNRMQLYLLPKLMSLEPLAIAGATHRGEEDWQTVIGAADKCASKCGSLPEKQANKCSASCPDAGVVSRLQQCRDPSWLPF